MKKRAFIAPVAAVVTALTASSIAAASVPAETMVQASDVQGVASDLTLSRSTDTAVRLADHASHSSHTSHASHASHASSHS